ncbi:MAG: phycobilisome protein [Oscillatoriophycideae cyanobacterium NC_groundwater_1537_Pr4_S-0.65um_50_18]|jgi:Phycobilisome protein|nr:phycobilisome protein [Oscillatoriophycideae cyanobacterium NC_groundwater_1537_Pr4_S-0.65um_50_18]
MTKPQLSEKALELIKKARIVSFSTWHTTYPPETIQRFQAADDAGRYLTDEDLEQIQAIAPDANQLASLEVVRMLRDRVREIVDEARGQVLETFPHITQPGGGLYPATRADACWRDFWHFLRCMTYGIAGQRTDYTSAEGLHYMQLLYQELQVPLDAMVVGLEGIKTASLKRIELDPKVAEQSAALVPYFDRLIERMKQFQS